ncbi:MAG: hypothetical protein R2722_05200 [Tessaracoccus sp.]
MVLQDESTHTGVDAGTGYVHTVTVTAANAGDITQAANLMRPDDEVGYADSGTRACTSDRDHR